MGSEAWRAGLFLRTWVKFCLIKKIFVLNRRTRMWRKARRAGHDENHQQHNNNCIMDLWCGRSPLSSDMEELSNNRWSRFVGLKDCKSIKWIAEKGEGDQKREKIEFCYIWWKCTLYIAQLWCLGIHCNCTIVNGESTISQKKSLSFFSYTVI